jgi:transcriptional regulator with XRE-family HTH domain
MRNQEFITPIDQYVIDFVRKLRDTKTLRQEDIASIIGVSREFIKDVENTNRRAKYNVRHINALADYFEMSPRDFLPEKPMKLSVEKPANKTVLKKKAENKKPSDQKSRAKKKK